MGCCSINKPDFCGMKSPFGINDGVAVEIRDITYFYLYAFRPNYKQVLIIYNQIW